MKHGLGTLQRMIDRTSAAHARAHIAESELMEYCLEKYGVVPGDIDADEIIDAVLGGCGIPSGMSADRFDEIMRSNGD